MFGFFLFCLDLELLIKKCQKPGFRECVETRSVLNFANNSRSKQNKKNPKHAFGQHWQMGNVCKISVIKY